MPLYLYACPTCSRKRDVFKSIADLDRTELCNGCGFAMNRQVTAAMIRPDLAGYECPITGKWIEGRVQHEENLRQHGCRVLEPGETQRAQAAAAAESEALYESIGDTAAKIVANMPPEKQEKLANELDAGLDLSYERASVT